MKKIFEKVKKVVKNSIQLFVATDMPLYSANAAFFLIISSIPIFMLLFSLLSFIPMVSVDDITRNINLLFPNLPYVKKALTYVINIANNLSTKGVVSLNLITAFIAGSTALYYFIIGIRKVHNITYKSNYIWLRILSFINMIVFFAAIIALFISFIFGSMILAYIKEYIHIPHIIKLVESIFSYKYFASILIIFVLMISLYATSTNFERRFKHNFIGAIVSTFLWLIVSNIYSVYFAAFPLSASVYGSLAGIIVVLLWLYTCMNIIFFGSVVNEAVFPETMVLKEQQDIIKMKISEGKDVEVDKILNKTYKKRQIKKIERPDLQ